MSSPQLTELAAVFAKYAGDTPPRFEAVDENSPDLLTLNVPPDGWPLPSLADLGSAVGLSGFENELPTGLGALAALHLTEAQFDSATGAVMVEVRWSGGSFPLVPGVLDVSDPGLRIYLDPVPDVESAAVALVGTLVVGHAELDTLVDIPSLATTAQLMEPYPLGPVLEHFGVEAGTFGEVKIAELLLSAAPEDKTIAFSLTLDDVWEPGGGFALDQVELSVSSTFGSAPLTVGRIAAAGHFAGLDLQLAADYAGPELGWNLLALAAEEKPLPIGHLLGELGGATDVPAALDSLTLSDLMIEFATRTKNLELGGVALIDVSDAKRLDLAATAAVTHHPDGTTTTSFGGQLTIAGLEFDITFAEHDEQTILLGVYRNVTRRETHLRTLVAAVSDEVAGVLGSADPTFMLSDVILAYEPADSATGMPSKFVFALDLDIGLDLSGLSDLPLIGSVLPADQVLKVAFQPLVASVSLPTPEDLHAINEVLPEGLPHLPAEVSSQFGFITTLRIGDVTRVFTLGGKEPAPKLAPHSALDLDANLGTPVARTSDATATPDVADPKSIHWVDLQKHFGPLHLDRVGLGLSHGHMLARLDAALAVGPLTLSLLGLGADYDMESKEFGFDLDGIGIRFEQDELSISGMFARDANGDGFIGAAELTMAPLSIGAMGAYTEVGGHPSFFIYAFVDYPLGGPPFFFVEGAAVGFGYNRRLRVPDVADLAAFPLVAEVTGHRSPGASVEAEIASLAEYLPPELDQYFLAIGLKFNSFKILDGFALLVVSFGNDLEFDLLGELTAQLPPADPDGGDSAAMAVVNLDFAAKYVPADGFLGASALIGAGSYVYHPKAHLTGGFASSSWFGGPHDGDFVFTLGGYHPHFVVPAHYPQPESVPRLALNWQVSPQLSVHGDLYFAVTSAAAMAGARVHASWKSGPLEAWFDLGIDLLIQWQPYHYEAQAHVEIGASVTIDPPIIGTIRITISAGADLEIWGPEFSGRANVHVSVMGVSVGFSVSFVTTPEGDPPALDWPDFVAAFLPKNTDVCSVTVAGGRLRKIEKVGRPVRQVVNPAELVLVTKSVIPSTGVDEHRPGVPFGVAPMHVDSASATQVISITRNGEPKDDDFVLRPVRSRFPAALWGTSHDPAVTLNGGSIVGLSGYEIRPSVPIRPATSTRIERQHLRYHVDPWFLPPEPAAPEAKTVTVDRSNRETFSATLAASAATRRATLEALGFDPGKDLDLNAVAVDAMVAVPLTVALKEPVKTL